MFPNLQRINYEKYPFDELDKFHHIINNKENVLVEEVAEDIKVYWKSPEKVNCRFDYHSGSSFILGTMVAKSVACLVSD